MAEKNLEEKINEYLRRGDTEKAKYLQSLRRRVLPTQVQRILRNDQTVLTEMVLPGWMSWSLLRQWAQENSEQESGKLCALCSTVKENGVRFNEKFICEKCFKDLKSISASAPQQ